MSNDLSDMVGRPTSLDFDLIDDSGSRMRLRDLGSKHALVFFGFTHCKVVCPRNLAKLSMVLDKLGDRKSGIAALYISVDPARDTPEVMRNFLASQYPYFTGLTGSKDAIEAVRKAFRVYASRRPDPSDPEGYEVPHSALTYLVAPGGELAAHFADTADVDTIVSRLVSILPRGEQAPG